MACPVLYTECSLHPTVEERADFKQRTKLTSEPREALFLSITDDIDDLIARLRRTKAYLKGSVKRISKLIKELN